MRPWPPRSSLRLDTYPGQADPPGDLVGDVLPVDVSDPWAGNVLHPTAAHPHLQREELQVRGRHQMNRRELFTLNESTDFHSSLLLLRVLRCMTSGSHNLLLMASRQKLTSRRRTFRLQPNLSRAWTALLLVPVVFNDRSGLSLQQLTWMWNRGTRSPSKTPETEKKLLQPEMSQNRIKPSTTASWKTAVLWCTAPKTPNLTPPIQSPYGVR